MKTRKQLVSLLLVFCIMLALAPAAAAADSTYTPAVMPNQVFTTSFTSARMTLPQLQEKFPEGRYCHHRLPLSVPRQHQYLQLLHLRRETRVAVLRICPEAGLRRLRQQSPQLEHHHG